MSGYAIRFATPADAQAICRIYNQGIEDRIATLETELRTPDERRQWLTARGPRHPVIVAEHVRGTAADGRGTAADGRGTAADGRGVVGWGSLNEFNRRDAYRFVVDLSIYVERAVRGKGVGRVMLGSLVDLARDHGFHKMVLSAFPWNPGGMALYTTMGFRTVGIYREQGLLDGRWVDTVVMEKLL